MLNYPMSYTHAKATTKEKGQKPEQLFHKHPDKITGTLDINIGNELIHITHSATTETVMKKFNKTELTQKCLLFKILPNLTVCIWRNNPNKGFIIQTGGKIANHLDVGDFKKGFVRYGVFLKEIKRLNAQIYICSSNRGVKNGEGRKRF